MLLFHCVYLCLLLLHNLWELDFILEFRDDFAAAIDVFRGLLARLAYAKGVWLCLRSTFQELIGLESCLLARTCLSSLLRHSQILAHAWRRNSALLIHLHLRLDLIRSDNYCVTRANLDLCGLVQNWVCWLIVVRLCSGLLHFILYLWQPLRRCLLLHRHWVVIYSSWAVRRVVHWHSLIDRLLKTGWKLKGMSRSYRATTIAPVFVLCNLWLISGFSLVNHRLYLWRTRHFVHQIVYILAWCFFLHW